MVNKPIKVGVVGVGHLGQHHVKHYSSIKETDLIGLFDIDTVQDELLKKAAHLVIDHQQASVSLLQRKFRIGYSRAGRLIDELEALGVVSGYSGSKARDVLVDESYLDNIFNG